jgi:hypothetical protein
MCFFDINKRSYFKLTNLGAATSFCFYLLQEAVIDFSSNASTQLNEGIIHEVFDIASLGSSAFFTQLLVFSTQCYPILLGDKAFMRLKIK